MKNIGADASFTVRIMNPATGLPVTGLAYGTVGGTWKFLQQGQSGAPTETVITLGAGTFAETEAGEYVLTVAAAANTVECVGKVVGSGLNSGYVALSVPEEIVDPAPAAALERMLVSGLLDAYAADGVAPTLEQAIMAIHQMLMQFAISGTTISVKKLNGTDQAFAVDLNNATAPTAAART